MAQQVTTAGHALRIMGGWVRRADALLADAALANAARAVQDERDRVGRQAVDLAALDLSPTLPRLAS